MAGLLQEAPAHVMMYRGTAAGGHSADLEGSRRGEALDLLAPLQDSHQGADHQGGPAMPAGCPLIIRRLGSY